MGEHKRITVQVTLSASKAVYSLLTGLFLRAPGLLSCY